MSGDWLNVGGDCLHVSHDWLDVKWIGWMCQMVERTLKCSIARDNGRASEFIRRKDYKDKSRCYECGVSHK